MRLSHGRRLYILPHAEFERIDHRKGAPYFTGCILFYWQWEVYARTDCMKTSHDTYHKRLTNHQKGINPRKKSIAKCSTPYILHPSRYFKFYSAKIYPATTIQLPCISRKASAYIQWKYRKLLVWSKTGTLELTIT